MSDDAREVDHAIDRLVAAYDAAGFPPARPPHDVESILAQIRSEIAPLRLPAQLERFWQRIDPYSLSVAPHPKPTSPASALTSWQQDVGLTPRLLFPVAYESWGYLFVELEDGRGSGGPVLEWSYGGSPYYLRFASLAAYVDLWATMIELGEFLRHEPPAHAHVQFDPHRRWDDEASARLSAAPPLPHFVDARELGEDPDAWPEHWLRADGLAPETRALRGATTTIAQLLQEAASGGSPSGTVHARIIRMGSSGAGLRMAIEDGTGALDVWCPLAVSGIAVLSRSDDGGEFDVVLRPDAAAAASSPHYRDMAEAVRSHDIGSARAAALYYFEATAGTPAAAEATAVRPV